MQPSGVMLTLIEVGNMKKNYDDLPYTIYEVTRESLSTIPEKSEEELYRGEDKKEKPKNIFSGKWANLEDQSMLRWFPSGEEMSLVEYTNMETGEFYLEYEGELKDNSYLFGDGFDEPVFLEIYSIPDTSNITDMLGIFRNFPLLESLNLSNFNTSKAITMESMFEGCSSLKSLDLSNFDTSKVISMDNMFYGCSSLTSLDLSSFNTSKVTSIGWMFEDCSSLESLDLSSFDVSNVEWMISMFYNCTKLGVLNISGWDFSNLNSYPRGMFTRCSSLKTVIGPVSGIKVDFYLNDCPLTPDSAMVFIKGLEEVNEGQSITFSRVTYDSLTPEQIDIATSKGWNVIRY